MQGSWGNVREMGEIGTGIIKIGRFGYRSSLENDGYFLQLWGFDLHQSLIWFSEEKL